MVRCEDRAGSSLADQTEFRLAAVFPFENRAQNAYWVNWVPDFVYILTVQLSDDKVLHKSPCPLLSRALLQGSYNGFEGFDIRFRLAREILSKETL